MEQLHIGQRIDIYEVKNDPYVNQFRINGWYAEVAGNKFHGNPYGRDMVCDNRPIGIRIHLNTIECIGYYDMRPVGTCIIKSLKQPK